MMDIKPNTQSEVGNNSFDLDKRIDVGQKADVKGNSDYDVDKRLETDRQSTESDSFDEKSEIQPELSENKGLTEEDKEKLHELTGWSDEILDSIGSWKEAGIYVKAGLKETEINEKPCLIRSDIDWNQKDVMDRTNKERVEEGLSPINKEEKVIELHHIGQRGDSPLAELTPQEHRGKENDAILHDKTKQSEIDRISFNNERCAHWETRIKESEAI